MATNEEILQELKALRGEVRALQLTIAARAEGKVAGRFELDGEHGDQEVRFEPKTFRGPSFKGQRFSRCTPDFLDHYARALDAMADKEDAERKLYKGKPASKYTRGRAALCRGWALRMRLGWKAPAAPAPGGAANGAQANGVAKGRNPFSDPEPAPPAASSTEKPSQVVDDPYAPREGDEDKGYPDAWDEEGEELADDQPL